MISINSEAIENAKPSDIPIEYRASHSANVPIIVSNHHTIRNVMMINQETHVLSLAPMDLCSPDESAGTPSNTSLIMSYSILLICSKFIRNG